ncbi:MAG: hypothetical protein AB7H90_12245 [Alphaproteobacteria bacterium]
MPTRPDLAIVPGYRTGGAPLGWRGFWRAGDLDIDFGAADRPALVTAILACCAEPPVADEEEIWQLTLAARIGGLLAIEATTSGAELLSLALRCPHIDCRESMEAALPMQELIALAREAEATAETQIGPGRGEGVRLRRPRGTDQRVWRRRVYADAAMAETAILDSLVSAGTLAPDDRAHAAAALAVFDPLSCFEIDTTCPACSRQADIPVDLEAVLLGVLARSQRQMLSEVDRLARRYGWSEAAILAIPAWRRRRYLALDGDGWPE